MYLRKPYEIYYRLQNKHIASNANVLELCCGMGEFTFDLAQLTQNKILAVDISPKSIEVAKQRAEKKKITHIDFVTSDIETLNLPCNHFDVICMAGSLSYVDVNLVIEKVKGWLNQNGCFIVVDTYGYNPFFNVKRRLNYLFNLDTKQTMLGIPKKSTIDKIRSHFESFEIHYCNTFAFIGPFLKYIVGEKLTAKLVDKLDDYFPCFKKYAFKFVFCAQGPK